MELCQHVKSMYCYDKFIKWIHATKAVDAYEFGNPEDDLGCQLDDFAKYMKDCHNKTWHAPDVLRDVRFDAMLYDDTCSGRGSSVSGAPAAAAAAAAAAPVSTPTLTSEQSAPAATDPPPAATAPAEGEHQSISTQQNEKPSTIEQAETIPAPADATADADAAIAPTADVTTTVASTTPPDATETGATAGTNIASVAVEPTPAIPAIAKAEPTAATGPKAHEPGEAHDTHVPPAAPEPSTAKVASPVIAPPPAKPLETSAKTTSSAAVEKQPPKSPAKAIEKAKAKLWFNVDVVSCNCLFSGKNHAFDLTLTIIDDY